MWVLASLREEDDRGVLSDVGGAELRYESEPVLVREAVIDHEGVEGPRAPGREHEGLEAGVRPCDLPLVVEARNETIQRAPDRYPVTL